MFVARFLLQNLRRKIFFHHLCLWTHEISWVHFFILMENKYHLIFMLTKKVQSLHRSKSQDRE